MFKLENAGNSLVCSGQAAKSEDTFGWIAYEAITVNGFSAFLNIGSAEHVGSNLHLDLAI
jgi:hypothetical protein